MARGSSLTSVLRQLFSAFGIAVFATLLQIRQATHLAELTYAGGGASSQELFLQASALALQDCILVAYSVAFPGLIPAFLLRTRGLSRRQE